MQELSCTVRGNQYKIRPPFFVLATQNPIELEGTYPLPEAQLDRFIFNVLLDYLSAGARNGSADLTTTTHISSKADAVTTAEEILEFQQLVRMVPIADSVARYAVKMVRATRATDASSPDFIKKYVNFGASVRAAQNLVLTAKARALMQRPLSRVLPGRHRADASDSAASHSAELPGRIRQTDAGRHLQEAAGGNTRSSCLAV